MFDWGITSIFTITIDNVSFNDTAIEFLKRRTRDKMYTILENEFMHMRWYVHILNFIVTKGLKDVGDFIVKILNAVKYEKFKD
jgi:hypothetical protein